MPAPVRLASIVRRHARRVACAIACGVLAAGALSCAPMRPAIRVIQVPPSPPSEIAPPGSALPEEEPDELMKLIPPDEELPGEAAPQAATIDDPLPAAPTTRLIALILPLDASAYARAASAVRDGFLDAAQAAGKRADCIVIAHGSDGVTAAFESAREKGVRVAVGPLVRDDLKTLAISHARLPWTVALNQLDDGSNLPRAIYSFPLTVESDARILAQRALAGGVRSVDVIEGDSPLMKRFASAFATAWVDKGGRAPSAYRFDATPEALTGLRRALTQRSPDAVLLAVNGDRAALLKPFIGGVRAYASGLVFERPPQENARDLDDVRIVEIPWLLTPDAPEFAKFPHRDFDSAALARLYALGLDAYRVAASFDNGPPGSFDLDGATGHVSLVPGRQFAREGRLAVYRDGTLVPLDAAP
jgi:uncharacterized protein